MRIYPGLLLFSALGALAGAVEVITETKIVTATIFKGASEEYVPYCDELDYEPLNNSEDSSDNGAATLL
ncbi:hypothetical protein GGF43_001710, partial [Coemansia sp. RSA 2618]